MWREGLEKLPSYTMAASTNISRHDVMKTIEKKIDELDPELRKLSVQIHGQISWCDCKSMLADSIPAEDNPELLFQERLVALCVSIHVDRTEAMR